jgi:hypothetical protein
LNVGKAQVGGRYQNKGTAPGNSRGLVVFVFWFHPPMRALTA